MKRFDLKLENGSMPGFPKNCAGISQQNYEHAVQLESGQHSLKGKQPDLIFH
jgi:hypothetical protein